MKLMGMQCWWRYFAVIIMVIQPLAVCIFYFFQKTVAVRGFRFLTSPTLSRIASIIKTMASKAARIAAVSHQIFGTVPNRGARTGMQYLKKPLTGAYESRYYMEPIEPIARKVCWLMFCR